VDAKTRTQSNRRDKKQENKYIKLKENEIYKR
jgi:hypothetical protein